MDGFIRGTYEKQLTGADTGDHASPGECRTDNHGQPAGGTDRKRKTLCVYENSQYIFTYTTKGSYPHAKTFNTGGC